MLKWFFSTTKFRISYAQPKKICIKYAPYLQKKSENYTQNIKLFGWFGANVGH